MTSVLKLTLDEGMLRRLSVPAAPAYYDVVRRKRCHFTKIGITSPQCALGVATVVPA